MGRLSTDQVLKDNGATDSTAISALKLNHKALSDVSVLKEFKKLQRLDIGFNSLTSLEDLKPCVNLYWLSVVQNKLQSLRGIEGLSKLAVLNAGKNKLTSMEEVRSLVGLRAIILNDNEIATICMLDQMKELTTLVLSRNPIREIGKSLANVKSLTKLSLSNCKLQAIDSSLKSCVELKELRLAHNNIKTLPAELAVNTKLQLLDLGNNWITSWSDLKVLKSLTNLRNLNLLGNPVVDNEKSTKKIRSALPNLQIFNTKPVNKSSKINTLDIEPVNDFDAADDVIKREDGVREKKPKRHLEIEGRDGDDNDTNNDTRQSEKEKKRKRRKSEDDVPNKEVQQTNETATDKKVKKSSKKAVTSEIDAIDDAETSFAELFDARPTDNPEDGVDKVSGRTLDRVLPQGDSTKKKKKTKKISMDPSEFGPSTMDVGMGGASTWDD